MPKPPCAEKYTRDGAELVLTPIPKALTLAGQAASVFAGRVTPRKAQAVVFSFLASFPEAGVCSTGSKAQLHYVLRCVSALLMKGGGTNMCYCFTADPLGAGQKETNPRPLWETGVFPWLP